MWKIIFTYHDGVKVKLTNSSRPMDKSMANKYYDTYGYNSDGGVFQQYPKKKYSWRRFRERDIDWSRRLGGA